MVQRIEEALAENMSVVIGLTSTGEASAMRAAGLKPAAALAALGLREDAPEAAEALAKEKHVPVELFTSALQVILDRGGEC